MHKWGSTGHSEKKQTKKTQNTNQLNLYTYYTADYHMDAQKIRFFSLFLRERSQKCVI